MVAIDTDIQGYSEAERLLREGVDCITSGFPCQDISVAGKKAGIQFDKSTGKASTRSGLFGEVLRTIRMVRPSRWVMENVAAIFNRELGTVLGGVASCGYDAEWDCVGAGTVGAPHHRARAYILAYPHGNGRKRHFPKSIQRQPEFSRWENVRSIKDIAAMPDIPEPLIRGSGNGVAKRLHGIGNGNPPCVIRELMKELILKE